MTWHQRSLRPGEVVLADLRAPGAVPSVTVSAFGSTWPAARVETGHWLALIGIDLATRPGPYTIVVTTRGPQPLTTTRAVTVTARRFPTRTLRVAPDYVDPPPALLARITDEAALLATVYARTSAEPLWSSGIDRPVADPANSSFGTRSVFNGQPRSPHAGTDFLSAAGTPAHAPAGGTVAVARDLFFTGNTVVIDHGLGVFSMLAHLSRIDVQEGDAVRRGDTIGLVGATGRVTGAHLHWAFRVGGARVDPLSAVAALGPAPSSAR